MTAHIQCATLEQCWKGCGWSIGTYFLPVMVVEEVEFRFTVGSDGKAHGTDADSSDDAQRNLLLSSDRPLHANPEDTLSR